MKKIFQFFSMFLLWIFFSPAFIYLIVKNKVMGKKVKMVAYFSTIISPFAFCCYLLVTISILIIFIKPGQFSINTIGISLNIEIPKDHMVLKNQIDYIDQDYDAEVILKFSEESIKDIIGQIEKSPFYNIKPIFFNDAEYKMNKSDSLFSEKVKAYFVKEYLIGYWIKENSDTYVFYAPIIGIKHNSVILFDEKYDVYARVSLKDGTLHYNYLKF